MRHLSTAAAVFGVVASLMLGSLAHAKEHAIRTKAFEGTYDVDTAVKRMTWSAYVDKTPAEIDTAMRKWKTAVALVDKIESFEVKKSSKRNATLLVVRKSPFFMPNFEMVIATKAVFDSKTNRGRSEWTQVSGTAKQLKRTWRYVPEGKGSRVTFISLFELPFNPPDFFLGDLEEEIEKSLNAFRKHVGAKTTQAKAPAPR